LLLSAIAVIILFFSVRAVFTIWVHYIEYKVAEETGTELADRLVRGYLGMPYIGHLSRNSSELLRNTTIAIRDLSGRVFLPVINLIAETLLVVTLLVVLVLSAPLATALALVVIVPAVLVIQRVIQPRMKRLGLVSHAITKANLQTLQQGLDGIRDVKVLGKEQFFAQAFTDNRRKQARAETFRGAAREVAPIALETALVFTIALVFAVSLVAGHGRGDVLSVLGLLAYVGIRAKPSLTKITQALNSIKFSSIVIDDLDRDLSEMADYQLGSGSGSTPPVKPLQFRDQLGLHNVGFRYPDGTEALRDVTLQVQTGDTIGICGPTGGGKSTLIDLMIGLVDPTGGRIEVDGLELAAVRSGWQRAIGIVPQNLFILDDTVRRNIALGEEGQAVDETALREAIRLAQLEHVIEMLPAGLDTVLGERGVRLSGGQRQRIAIARALYRRPQVLIFDEGTSALDNTTESELIDALHQLGGGRTIIMVAHRLSSVRSCDRIVVVDDGRIVDVGTYEALVDRNALFARMVGQAPTPAKLAAGEAEAR
jgi:ATP-binding cassette, subfamily B, bacterial PglK